MDAQNAVEPASTKPPASPKRTGIESEQPRLSTAAKLFGSGKPDLSAKDNTKPHVPTAHPHPHDDEAGADGNSDAETIVLPGKDGHSPSKIRKIIKHEDKSDTENPPAPPRGRKHDSNGRRERERERDGDRGADRGERKEKSVSVADNHSDRAASLVKKKKLADKSRAKDGSSGLSSAPASPPQRRRRSSIANSKSDSETAHVESPRLSSKEKSRLADKVVPHKRKAPRPDSEDDAESRKIRRQRTSGSGLDASRRPHPPPKSHLDTHTTAARNRSPSPPPRAHRRSLSTQLPGHSNGLSHKKKRVPAPLQSTDYHSDESSASGSPHPRSSKLRSLATPATAESTISPAKMAPHKKHLDAHGQTFLARACAKGEFDAAKHRLQERPEDIDVADYAGNTPLQIAAINGYVDIVKLLVDAQCNLECVNNDKDTPLIDAVENGHLDVVKVLLAAGVNPRRANAYGQEPLERVSEDDENADEIKRLLEEAKEHMGERRRTSEDHLDHTDARSSHGPDSPRRSPGASGSINAASGRRAATVRATKTSNHLLYMPMDDKTLRQAAARGDEETVTRILQVRDTFDDPESMVAAARGGHDICMQLLLALGKANPDPAPISNNDYSTPMLAAIGQENTKVIRLLLDQNDFDPTRRYKGETYYELARRRRGPNWADEEHMLKLAYDEHKKNQRGDAKTKSPNRREQDREARRARAELKDESSKAHKRKAPSPTREPKKTPKILTSPKEKRRSNSLTAHLDEQTSPKRGPGRPKKDDRVPTIAISDREASPAVKQPAAKVKRTEADTTAASSEGEALKPRRKLISGRELKGDRSQQVRRASMASNTPSLKEPSSPRDESDKPPMAEKFLDRTKALKRDESRDRLSTSGENTGKRHRSSATPPHSAPGDKDAGEAPPKKRRLDVDGKERRPKAASSDDRHLKAPVSRDSSTAGTSASRIRSKSRDDEERRPPKSKKLEGAAEHVRRESGKSISSENSIHVKSEDADVDMPDAPHPIDAAAPDSRAKEKDAEEKKKDAEEKKKSIEERKRLFEEKRQLTEERRLAEEKKEAEKKRHEEEERAKTKEKERLRLEEEERKQREEDKRRAEEKRRKEEEEKKLQEEEARKQRELEEKRQREEEQERRRVEEAERKRKEEEERKLQEELELKRQEEEKRLREQEEMRKKEEEEKKAREEEERLRREQLEREAAEELRRKREEEERKELERKQEMERRRLAREAELRRIRLEQERIRVAKLPALLQWLDGCANPKTPEIAETFRMTQGIRYDCLRPEATGTPEGREQWLLNTQVALLLGEKDLELSRCMSSRVCLESWHVIANARDRLQLGSHTCLDVCERGHLAPRGGSIRLDIARSLRTRQATPGILRGRGTGTHGLSHEGEASIRGLQEILCARHILCQGEHPRTICSVFTANPQPGV